MQTLLFVYGTLKKGQRLHEAYLVDEDAVKVAEGYIDGYELYVIEVADLPFVIPANEKRVYGEVYVVGPELLQRLDVLEGGYLREETEFVATSDRGGGSSYRVEVYVWNSAVGPAAKYVESGNYSGRA